MRPVIVHSQSDRANVLAGILMSRLENTIESNSVVGVQLVPPNNMSVLLPSVQTHVKDRISLNAVVAAELMTDSKLH